MRIRLSEFKKIIQKFLSEAIDEMEQESVDRVNRHERGYDDSEFDESVDRMNRARDGYGETEFEEASLPPSAPQSAKPKVKDKSQMQGVGPRPTMANAFNDPGKKQEAAAGTVDPNLKPKSASSSAALHTRDKSQMQGVGPRPTMATAFGDQSQQKKEDDEPNFDPGKTNVLNKDFVHPGEKERQQIKQGRQDQIKQISQQHQAQMQKDGWKFEKHPSGEGNWTATPPEVPAHLRQKTESKKKR